MQQSMGCCHQLLITERQGMSGLCPLGIRTNQSIVEIRWITDDGIILFIRFKHIHISQTDLNPISKGRMLHIVCCLRHSALIDVDSRHTGLRIPLRHHQRHQTSSRTDVENPSFRMACFCPSPEECPVGSDFHCTAVLMHNELLECKAISTHIRVQR